MRRSAMANSLVARPGSASSAVGRVVLWREKIDTVAPSGSQWQVALTVSNTGGGRGRSRDDRDGTLTLGVVTQDHRSKSGFETRAIHAGYEPDPTTGAVIPPIYATSTYKQDGVGGLRGGYEYSRSRQPDPDRARGCLAALEEGERGFAFATGLAAEDTLLRGADPAGRPRGHPRRRVRRHLPALRQGRAALGPRAHPRARRPTSTPSAAAIRPGQTRIVWVETPTNPLLTIGDIEALASVAHDAGALLVVDNTFASPYLQQPLALGADVVVHSTTKYVGGHSDVVGGAVVVRDLDLAEPIAFHQNAIGAVAGPFDCCLTLRGLKTLGVRMDRHCDNAEQVVEFLTGHPTVGPGVLPRAARAPGPRVAARQMKRFGGIVAFRHADGEQAALDVCGRAEVFTLGESLGGVESLIEHPGRMTHASVAGTELEVPDDLIRLSVGIETVDDLIADLDRPSPDAPAAVERSPDLVLCVDFGSTFTKAALVDLTDGRIARAAEHRTTIDTDVLDGYDACLAALVAQDAGAADAPTLACSRAGGGLRIAVVGNEELVTAEAGRRVALSSGGKVVAVLAAGRGDDLRQRRRQRARRRAAHRRHRRRQPRADPGLRARDRWPRAGAAPSWSPATSTPVTRSRRSWPHNPLVVAPNVVPADRRARPRGRAHGDPRAVPVPRDRRQAPEQPRRLPGDGAGRHPRRRPDRGRAARRGGGRHRRRRRRRRHHRRALRRRARPRGRRRSAARWSPPRPSPAPSRATSACAGRPSPRRRPPDATTSPTRPLRRRRRPRLRPRRRRRGRPRRGARARGRRPRPASPRRP